MKNAILVSLAKQRWAIELGWVSDVITLGHVTIVPKAPAVIYGVINLGGALVPVIDILKLSSTTQISKKNSCSGDYTRESLLSNIAILLQVESVRIALRIDAVIEVETLRDVESRWVDSTGVSAQLIDPAQLIEDIRINIDGEINSGINQLLNRSESRDR